MCMCESFSRVVQAITNYKVVVVVSYIFMYWIFGSKYKLFAWNILCVFLFVLMPRNRWNFKA
jgi:hypothetical protein